MLLDAGIVFVQEKKSKVSKTHIAGNWISIYHLQKIASVVNFM